MTGVNILTKTIFIGEFSVANDQNWDNREDNGQMVTEVEIRLHMVHNALIATEEHVT